MDSKILQKMEEIAFDREAKKLCDVGRVHQAYKNGMDVDYKPEDVVWDDRK